MYKLIVLSVFLAVASAGYIGAPIAYSSPVVAHAPVVHAVHTPVVAHAPLVHAVHAPVPLATSYANTYKVSVKAAPIVYKTPVVAAPVIAAPAVYKTPILATSHYSYGLH